MVRAPVFDPQALETGLFAEVVKNWSYGDSNALCMIFKGAYESSWGRFVFCLLPCVARASLNRRFHTSFEYEGTCERDIRASVGRFMSSGLCTELPEGGVNFQALSAHTRTH